MAESLFITTILVGIAVAGSKCMLGVSSQFLWSMVRSTMAGEHTVQGIEGAMGMLQANVAALATIRREMAMDIFGFQGKNWHRSRALNKKKKTQ